MGLAGDHQQSNAALAVLLVKYWVASFCAFRDSVSSDPLSLDVLGIDAVANGLRHANWPGRAQIIQNQPRFHYYIDGAHTQESLTACAQWFVQNVPRDNGHRILVFNCTMGRDPIRLLQPLLDRHNNGSLFHRIYFTDNRPFLPRHDGEVSKVGDLVNRMVAIEDTLLNQKRLAASWKDGDASIAMGCVKLKECVSDTVQDIESQPYPNDEPVHVLVTGSLHLVGSFLTVLQQPVQ